MGYLWTKYQGVHFSDLVPPLTRWLGKVALKTYENWKVVFTASMGMAPPTPDYKLSQLRNYLSGEDLKSIDGLGIACEGET